MGKRSGYPETEEDLKALTLAQINHLIANARWGYEKGGTAQGRKAFFKQLVWLEAHRQEAHEVIAPKRRFNSN
jgi:hypothetical protein